MQQPASRQSAGGATPAIPISAPFERFAALGAIITGLSSLLYAVFFLLVTGALHDYLPSFFLALGGLLATAVLTALYQRVRSAEPTFAAWAFGLGFIGQVGTAIHGVYGLASVISKAPVGGVGTSAPNPVDPAGFLAFGLTGLSTLVFAWLIVRSGQLPRGLGYLGYLLGVLLIALFLGALFTNTAKSLFVLVPGGLASLLATPIWNFWLGAIFLRRRSA
jgi:hypothetical protein